MAARPIFVLGLQRSGTTWLANLLASHSAIAAVAAEDHNGVHESIFFSHFARAFGPWSKPANRDAFAEAFAHSDYWLLTGLPDAELTEIMSAAGSYADVFCATMDRFAASRGATGWVEKSPHHALMSPEIAAAVPDARFIMVLRNTEGMVLSRLSGFGRQPPTGAKRAADLARATMVNTLFARSFRRLALRRDHLLVSYEHLRLAQEEESRRILEFLGIDEPDTPLVSAFAPNSSFCHCERPRLGNGDRAVIAAAALIASVMPLSTLRKLHNLRGRKRGVVWPNWCWKRTGWRPKNCGTVEITEIGLDRESPGHRPR